MSGMITEKKRIYRVTSRNDEIRHNSHEILFLCYSFLDHETHQSITADTQNFWYDRTHWAQGLVSNFTKFMPHWQTKFNRIFYRQKRQFCTQLEYPMKDSRQFHRFLVDSWLVVFPGRTNQRRQHYCFAINQQVHYRPGESPKMLTNSMTNNLRKNRIVFFFIVAFFLRI